MNDILFHRWAIDGYPSFVAAKLWLQGHSEAIYQPQLWVPDGGHPLWKRTMALNGVPNAGTAFVYHPIYLLLVAPFAALLTVDQFVWLLLAVNAMSAGVLALELVRLSENGAGDRNLLAAAAVCVSFPALYGAFLGQNVLPTLVLLIVGWRFLMERKVLCGVALLVLSIAMKAWVAPVVFLAFASNGRRAFSTGVFMSLVFLAIVPFFLDADLLISYFDVASRLSRITVSPFNNVSVTAWLTRLANPEWVSGAFVWSPNPVSSSVRYGASIIFAAVLLVAYRCYQSGGRSAAGLFFGSLALLLLLPSVCWSHYLIFMLPAAVFLWLRGQGWRSSFGLLALVLLMIPWHAFPGGFLLRGAMKEWVSSYPATMVWILFLPMVLSLFLGLSVLSAKSEARAGGA